MEIDAVLEANKNLNKRIEKLKAENEHLWRFKEMYKDQLKHNKELWRQLNIKRKVARVDMEKDGLNYVLQIVDVIDTPDGLYIKVF